MNEVKMPKRPILAYYILIFLAIFLFNSIFVPMLRENAVKEVDYSSFMTMTENQEIDKVQVEQDKILFTKKGDKQAYKTAIMNDPELVERLHKSGADFTGEIVEAMNPLLSALLSWVQFPDVLQLDTIPNPVQHDK